jgi:hypothetical protein
VGESGHRLRGIAAITTAMDRGAHFLLLPGSIDILASRGCAPPTTRLHDQRPGGKLAPSWLRALGWKPTVAIEDLVRVMVTADLDGSVAATPPEA